MLRLEFVLHHVLELCYDDCLGEDARQETFRSLMEMSQDGVGLYPQVCLCIGECYRCGFGVEKNEKKALEYDLLACKEQFPILLDEFFSFSRIENRIAGCYENGVGTKQSNREAFRWYSKAAIGNHAASAEKIAEYYEKGIYVAPDTRKAEIFRDFANRIRRAERDNQMEIAF